MRATDDQGVSDRATADRFAAAAIRPSIIGPAFRPPGVGSIVVQRRLAFGVQVPDILSHDGARTEFYEIKPDSKSGKRAGRDKLLNLAAFYGTRRFPYVPGTTYIPTPELPLGRVHRVEFFVSPFIFGPGLILYKVCARGPATELTLPLLIAAAFALCAGARGFKITDSAPAL